MINKDSILNPIEQDQIPDKYKNIRFDKKTIRLYLLISIIYFLVLLTLGFFFKENSFMAVLELLLALILIVFLNLVLSDAFGRKKHFTFINSSIGMKFRNELNFKTEHLNGGQYHGLIGEYEGYIMRIYFDWNTVITSRNVSRELCFHIYYSPGGIPAHDWEIKLQELNNGEIYEPHYEGVRRYSINHAELHRKYNFLSTYGHYIKALDHFIAFLKEMELKPLELEYVTEINEEDPYINMPQIETLIFDSY